MQPRNTCVWCLAGADTRHPDRKNAELSRISTLSAWREFKRHTVRLENETLRCRLTMLVESISALTDAFAADIYYHKHCWLQYVVNTQIKKEEEIHLQGVSYSEMQTLFLRKVDEIIFSDHEIRSLQSLLREYRDTANEYGFTVGDLKSSYLKEILVKEFGDARGKSFQVA